MLFSYFSKSSVKAIKESDIKINEQGFKEGTYIKVTSDKIRFAQAEKSMSWHWAF